jgi:hypothetical protein
MIRRDRPLHALRALVQFDLVRVGAEVAQAVDVRATTQREVADATQRCNIAAEEVRTLVGADRINPALLTAMQGVFRIERRGLEGSQGRLELARQAEHTVRAKLTALRNRERSLERALKAEHRREDLRRQLAGMAVVDELWLQKMWQELS